ncbi:MAG: glycine zipper 2TM domain-containing protein [Proteobacteria bacterium]|nr:glycine zipper 2TM domain-containing protein [Pseudomonadota bacterium]
MKKRYTLTVLLLMMFSTLVKARQYDNTVYARVLEVRPIYSNVSIPERRQVCDDRYRSRNKHSHKGAILGGIIGGVIGNRFGKGHGRDASTVLGVAIGAGVGSQNDRRRNNSTRCYTETYYYDEQRIVAYDVSYEHSGQVYNSRMNTDPGDRVRIRVNVSVVD